MPFDTGTFDTIPELMNKVNTFLLANGWTKLRGETDMACASPKAARYWRINVRESSSTGDSYRALNKVELRGTLGGASLSTDGSKFVVSSVASGAASNLAAGGDVTSAQIYDDRWWVTYDFGSATTVREVALKATSSTSYRAPRDFEIQWSNDYKTWTTMYRATGQTWSASEVKVFSFNDGYLDPNHASSTKPRRSGGMSQSVVGQQAQPQGEASHDIWCWQGPGYDAARRVYIFGCSYYDLTVSLEAFRIGAAVGIDTVNVVDWAGGQEGQNQNVPYMTITSPGTKTYWLYINSSRMIIVVKNGVDDYTNMYVGFMRAFAQPDDWAFPLFVGTVSPSLTALSDTSSRYRGFHDPGDGWCAMYRRWDGNWQYVNNHQDVAGTVDRPIGYPYCFTWPFHNGWTDRNAFPYSVVGDYADFDAHFMDRIDPTEQGELPMIPVIVSDFDYGNVGALDGVFAIPRGGVLSAEQVITIGGTGYRVFQTRAKSNGNHFYAIRED